MSLLPRDGFESASETQMVRSAGFIKALITQHWVRPSYEGTPRMRSNCFHSKKPAVELQEHSPSTHDRRCVRVGRLVIYFLS
jgi:hypothetical protein